MSKRGLTSRTSQFTVSRASHRAVSRPPNGAAKRSQKEELGRLRTVRAKFLELATAAQDEKDDALEFLEKTDSKIALIEAQERTTNRLRRVANLREAHRLYRDGEVKDLPQHREIERRYAWREHHRKSPLPRNSKKLMAVLRLRELERLFSSRYGSMLPNDDAGADDLWIAAQHIRWHVGDVTLKIVAWARVWAPWCTTKQAEELAKRVIRAPRQFRADTLARKLGLTYRERQELGIRTIGSIDVGATEREQRRRLRARERERDRRRKSGVSSRDEYLANALSNTRPWDKLGISRSTWYRRGRPASGMGRGGLKPPMGA